MLTTQRPSLYITILSIFICISMLIAGSVAWYNYTKGTQLAKQVADTQLQDLSEKVLLETNRILEPSMSIISLVSDIEEASAKPSLHMHPTTPLLLAALERYPQLLSAFFGFDDGDFYQVVSFLGTNAPLRKALGAPPAAIFGLRSSQRVDERQSVSTPPLSISSGSASQTTDIWVWLNKERKIVGSRATHNSAYDPRTRPWFQQAGDSGGMIMTDYYIFASSKTLGFTTARRFDGVISGVMGVDMTVYSLSQFLKRQKAGTHGLVFMFTEDGKLTAYPDPEQVVQYTGDRKVGIAPVYLDAFSDPVASKVYSLFKSAPGADLKEFTLNNEIWLARITPIHSISVRKEFVAVVVPLSDFTAALDKTRLESLLFACGVIICMLPIIIFVSRRISKPLSLLALETDEIRHFRLDTTVEIHSRIKEVAELASAFKSMKQTLSTFSKYLPTALVRQFVTSEIVPVLGGERRELSLLFSDVANFTTISERLDAETLMLLISQYFQELGTPVLQSSGTIDKFIGDAMMAFWNAPLLQDDHPVRACTAALQCSAIVTKLNIQFALENKDIMGTRFGLHVGECIVGNVGTTDRMNYTAMGANVNLAARLEGLNKFYRTSILASDAIVKKTYDTFLFRSIDIAQPKGTTEPVYLYELIGAQPDHGAYGPLPTDADIQWYSRWETAMQEYRSMHFPRAKDIFEQLLQERPGDHVTGLYLQRCSTCISAPPDNDWSPVIVYAQK